MEERKYWFWLNQIQGLGIIRIQKLLSYFGKPESVFRAKEYELKKIPGIGSKLTGEIIKNRSEDWIESQYDKMEKQGIYFVSRADRQYPKKLLPYIDAPIGLYYKGNLPNEETKSVAIVGARECSHYGSEMAVWFARELAKAGIQVISGMARGIDSFAHIGAIKGKGITFAVLGSGADICYPPENRSLYDRIVNSGGVLSEYGAGIPPFAGNFPMRNRIISGLCDGILVVEAREKSGSLITADIGLEQGKDIFAVPGRIGDNGSYGCNQLIKMGAYIVQSPRDILENFHYQNGIEQKKNNYMLETTEKIVYASLSYQPKHVTEILEETGINYCEILNCLIALESNGFIKQTIKNFYILANE